MGHFLPSRPVFSTSKLRSTLRPSRTVPNAFGHVRSGQRSARAAALSPPPAWSLERANTHFACTKHQLSGPHPFATIYVLLSWWKGYRDVREWPGNNVVVYHLPCPRAAELARILLTVGALVVIAMQYSCQLSAYRSQHVRPAKSDIGWQVLHDSAIEYDVGGRSEPGVVALPGI